MRDVFYQPFTYQGQTQLDLLSSIFNQFKNYMQDKFVIIFTVDETTENNADLISFIQYGNYDYWWLIVQFNNITDPFTELVRGTKLAIPSINNISEFIQTQEASNSANLVNIEL